VVNLKEEQRPQQRANNWVPVTQPEPFSIEWVALNFLKAWTPEDIKIAIKKHVEIELGPFIGLVEEKVMGEVMDFMARYRPDLHEVLNTDEGREWLRWNIRRILRR
jgi:hypothetical protein